MAKKSSIWFDGEEYRYDSDLDDYVCRKDRDGKPVVVKYKEARRKKYVDPSHCKYCDPLVVHGPGVCDSQNAVAAEGTPVVQESKEPKLFDRSKIAKNIASLMLRYSKAGDERCAKAARALQERMNDAKIRYAATGYDGFQGVQGASGYGSGSKKNSIWFNGYEYQWDDRLGDYVSWVYKNGKSTPITYQDALKKARKEAKKNARVEKKKAKANIREKERELKETETKSWSETQSTKFKATKFDLYSCASFGNDLRKSWSEWSVVVAQMKEQGFSQKRIDKFVDMAVEKSVDTFRRAYKHNGGIEALLATMQGFSPIHAKAIQSQFLDKLSPDESENEKQLERLVRDVFAYGAREVAYQANPNVCRSVASQLKSSYDKGLSKRGYFDFSGARDKKTVVSAFQKWSELNKKETGNVRKETKPQRKETVPGGGRTSEPSVGRNDEDRRSDAGTESGMGKGNVGSDGGGTGGGGTSLERHNGSGGQVRDSEEPRRTIEEGAPEPIAKPAELTEPEPSETPVPQSEPEPDPEPQTKEEPSPEPEQKEPSSGREPSARKLANFVAGAMNRKRSEAKRQAGLISVLREYRALKEKKLDKQITDEFENAPTPSEEETEKKRREVQEERRRNSKLWGDREKPVLEEIGDGASEDGSRPLLDDEIGYPESETKPNAEPASPKRPRISLRELERRKARAKEAQKAAKMARRLKKRAQTIKYVEKPVAVKESNDPGVVPGRPETEKIDFGKGVYSIPISDLRLDPARFQFKQAADKETGVSDEYKGVKFDPELSNTLMIWRDPQDGNDYVVNGHHRFQMAKSSGYDGDLQVRYVNAKTADDAKAAGAVANIVDGKGTELDFADVLRYHPNLENDDKVKNAVAKENKIARNGRALARLSDDLYDKVKIGKLDPKLAVPIGEKLGFSKADNLDDAAKNDLKKKQRHVYDYWIIKKGMKNPEQVRTRAFNLIDGKVPEASKPGAIADLWGHTQEDEFFWEETCGELIDDIKSVLLGQKTMSSKLSRQKNAKIAEDMIKGEGKVEVDVDLAKRVSKWSSELLKQVDGEGLDKSNAILREAKLNYHDLAKELRDKPKDREASRDQIVAETIQKLTKNYEDWIGEDSKSAERKKEKDRAASEAEKAAKEAEREAEKQRRQAEREAEKQRKEAERAQKAAERARKAAERAAKKKEKESKPEPSAQEPKEPNVETVEQKPKEPQRDPNVGKDLDSREQKLLRFMGKTLDKGSVDYGDDIKQSAAKNFGEGYSAKFTGSILDDLIALGYVDHGSDNKLTLSQKGRDALLNIGTPKKKPR